MKKASYLFYLLILISIFIVKPSAFAVEESAAVVEESTVAKSVCRDALIAKLSDGNKDIVSGAIMIAHQLRPSDPNPQVNLYHIFLAAMTEVRVDGAPITYTDPKLLDFLRRQNLLEGFQNFLLNNVGSNRARLDSLFEKRSDGTFILNWNTDIKLGHNYASNFINYTLDAEKVLVEMRENERKDRPFPDDFFLYILEFDNPIRRFFFDHLTEAPNSSERASGPPNIGPSPQMRIEKIKSMYHGVIFLIGTPKKAIPTNPILAFDLISRRIITPSNTSTNPSPYFSTDDLSLYPSPLLLDSGIHKEEEFIKVLEQHKPLDDFNRFVRFKGNNTYIYGKIIGFSEDHTSLIVESLDGQRYTYNINRNDDKDLSFLDSLFIEGEEFTRFEDAFLPHYFIRDVFVSLTSKMLFDIYGKIRGLIGSPMPLNQHTEEPSINLFRELFNLITLNNYLRKHYPELEARQVSLSDFDENRHFVSFLNSQGERVPGKLVEVNNYSVVVEGLNGHKHIIEGEMLNAISQDKSVKFLFQYPSSNSVDTSEIDNLPTVQRKGEGGESYAELEMSGDPAQDAFRKALIAGRFEGDERFISFFDQSEKKLARVISWEARQITLQVYIGNGDISGIKRRTPLPAMSVWNASIFSTAAVSGGSERLL